MILKGIPITRRNALEKKLNDAFSKSIDQEQSQEEAYVNMVETYSYRLLDLFTYEKKPAPFRSNRCTSPPPETEGSTAGTNLLDWEINSNSSVSNTNQNV